MTYDSRISKLEDQIDELDREYYRSKLEELSWCLPVVRAAKAWKEWRTGYGGLLVDPVEDELFNAVEALQAARGK
jgi:hypothetical protein